MQPLASIIDPKHVQPKRPSRYPRRRYRRDAVFARDPGYTPLDRNQRARLLYLADTLRRRTRPKGARDGVVGVYAVTILKALLCEFQNRQSGRCDPSYLALQSATGFCRATIARGLAQLERAGLVRIVRRIARQRVQRISPITGLAEVYVGVVQTSNAYGFAFEPPAWAFELPVGLSRIVPFPLRSELTKLARFVAPQAESVLRGETPKEVFNMKKVGCCG